MTEYRYEKPYFFNALFKEKIWGGDHLAALCNKQVPQGAHIGESWELSGYGDDQSVIAEGPFRQKKISDIVLEKRSHVLGPHAGSTDIFPLLYKFIDANDKLSVQVHPDDEQARKNGWGDFGKTECWYIVDAKEGARIIVGLKEGVTRDDISRSVETNTLDTLLNYIPIQKGDTLHIPAGTVHAILDGTVIYEVQETSDTTFRLYDWGRVDAQGNPRDLHVDQSLQVLDTFYHHHHKITPLPLVNTDTVVHQVRVACRYFSLEEFRITSEITIAQRQSFQVVTVLDGAVKHQSDTVIKKGQTVLFSADNPVGQLTPLEQSHFLLSYIPDLTTDIITPLQKAGYHTDDIIGLGGNPQKNDLISLL